MKSTFFIGGFKPSFSKIRSSIHPLILELTNLFNQREETINKLKEQQFNLLQSLIVQSEWNHYMKTNLESSYISEKNDIESNLCTLYKLYSEEILPPWDISDLKQLECNLKLQIKQINLCIMELNSVSNTEFLQKRYFNYVTLLISFLILI